MIGESSAVQLNPELQHLHDQVMALKQEVEAATDGLTAAQLNWSPAPTQWSIAQCLDHLNLVGYMDLPLFEAAIDQLHAQNLRGDGPFRYSLWERWFIRILSPNPPFKIPVPPQFVPAESSETPTDVVPRFLALQDALLRSLESANGYDLTRVKITSPVNRLFKLRLGAWYQAAVGHEQYHWLQAQAVRSHSDFPAI